MDKLKLLLAIHCHQPVGNFGVVFSKAYKRAYLPFIEALEKHPNIKISLHYSGSLLDWLKLTHPEFIKRIRNLVRRDQVEILAGGYYEPILSLIPQSDAEGQIKMLKKEIKDLFLYQADACWLSERVWEPKLPSMLNRAGIKWTIIDDSHFKSADLGSEGLSGYYISEEEGRPLAIFPASERLRYLIPFKLPEETIDYLRNLYQGQKKGCICFADDGEKFGFWPGIDKSVYEQGWLEDFFTALEENSSWLTVKSFSQYLNEYPSTARIYLNCVSYREMMDWSGGYFRNFLLKYEEANWMHKRMLYVSNKLQSISNTSQPTVGNKCRHSPVDGRVNAARQHLYMAQSNDAYWHGVFGGLYLNYLRSSVYSNLIEAEKLIQNSRKYNLDMQDLDCNGQAEVILSSRSLSCVFAPHRGGTLLELDYKPKSINLINTLMRRQEACHQRLKQNLLFYDLFPRCCCLDHFLSKETGVEQFFESKYLELGDFAQGEYSVEIRNKNKNKIGLELRRSGEVSGRPVKIIKGISLKNNDLILSYTIKNESSVRLADLFGVEFNLSVYDNELSAKCGEIKTDYINSARKKSPNSTGLSNGVKVSDVWNNISLEFNTTTPASVWHFPVQTVSNSEIGIERIYQQLCLMFNWSLDIVPYSDWSIRLSLRAQEL